MTAVVGRFDHLLDLTDDIGTFEHAELAIARREHGYCVDDVARVLVAVVREPVVTRPLLDLARTSFRFLTSAQRVDGRVRNRRSVAGRWSEGAGVGDPWGRSLWAFGTCARRAPERWMRESALASFERGATQRSPWPRSMAFAALGAADILAVHPTSRFARDLLVDAVEVIGSPICEDGWCWPERRLTYANAALAEALIAAGDLLHRPSVRDDGLAMLRWLLDRETVDGHLSPTSMDGSGVGDAVVPAFDQQPIEVAAMADACIRAADVSGEPEWLEGVLLAARWFDGDNDAGVVMDDPLTGGGFDGLHRDRANRNQGAESTIALVLTRQRAQVLAAARS